MKDMNGIRIIGVDHGYGNIKTANCCFLSGVAAFDEKPPVGYDLLLYDGRYYLIGALHKIYSGVKVIDGDYYILTLAAIARELRREELTSAKVYLAVGLPLSWVTTQSKAFRDYLLKNESADFTYRDIDYHIEFAGCEVFPQGFAAVADRLKDFPGHHVLCDIGNGTMNILHIKDGKPDATRMFTEEYGTKECSLAIREALMRQFQAKVDESVITEVFCTGSADIDGNYLAVITAEAKKYADGVFKRLAERGYDPKQMRLYVVGGGGCILRNFGAYDASRTTVIDDICATAKGYEFMAESRIRRHGGLK